VTIDHSALCAAEAARCNGTALRKANRSVSQLYDAVLAPCGLRSTQRSILAQVLRAGRPSIGELAGALVLDRTALAHNLKPLERDGLIRIVTDENDKRARVLILTERGRAKFDESTPLWEHAQHCFESVFGVTKAKALRTALTLLASPEFVKAFQGTENVHSGKRQAGPKNPQRLTRKRA
jgi:DNA-binding MarR family transcriptional regulator